MVRLYLENDDIKLYGTYNTDQEARKAIVDYYTKAKFKSYYWNCYTMPEDSEFAGGTHVDFGSWSIFFIIMEED